MGTDKGLLKLDGKTWRDVKVDPQMATDIENTILTRARELRVAQLGTGRN